MSVSSCNHDNISDSLYFFVSDSSKATQPNLLSQSTTNLGMNPGQELFTNPLGVQAETRFVLLEVLIHCKDGTTTNECVKQRVSLLCVFFRLGEQSVGDCSQNTQEFFSGNEWSNHSMFDDTQNSALSIQQGNWQMGNLFPLFNVKKLVFLLTHYFNNCQQLF